AQVHPQTRQGHGDRRARRNRTCVHVWIVAKINPICYERTLGASSRRGVGLIHAAIEGRFLCMDLARRRTDGMLYLIRIVRRKAAVQRQTMLRVQLLAIEFRLAGKQAIVPLLGECIILLRIALYVSLHRRRQQFEAELWAVDGHAVLLDTPKDALHLEWLQ